MSKWIEFNQIPKSNPKHKTDSWSVMSIGGHEVLGFVRWFGRWRQYGFFPSINTVYERQCLRDIADFCETKTMQYRQSTKETT